MRILIVADAFPPDSGGSGWSTFELARALQGRGHQVDVVRPAPEAQGTRERVYEGVAVTEFGYRVANVPGLRAWQRNAVLGGTFSTFLAERAHRVQVIHAQHLLSIPASVRAGRLARVPVVSTVRDYWPICLYGTLWRDGGICPRCRGAGAHRCLEQRYGPAARLAVPLAPFVERELARRQRALQESDAVIAVSHYVEGQLRGLVRPEKVTVIPNLVDVAGTRQQVTADAEPAKPPYILFVGKLNRMKGADVLPGILQRANIDCKLIVAGSGELESTLRDNPNIDVRGWLPKREVLQLLARARALVFPSRWAEPLARTLLEAQALGTPTVALDTGGTRDIITHEVNGLLASDVPGLAFQLARLMTDEALRDRLRRAAWQVAEEKFASSVIVPQFESVYARVQLSAQAAAVPAQNLPLPT